MTYQHKIVSHNTLDQGYDDFDLDDEKGRPVGVIWKIAEVTTALEGDDDELWVAYWRLDWAELTHYTAWVQSTRGAFSFGAGQRKHRFLTIEEAWAKKEALVKGSEARYAKKYGKQG